MKSISLDSPESSDREQQQGGGAEARRSAAYVAPTGCTRQQQQAQHNLLYGSGRPRSATGPYRGGGGGMSK